MNKQIKLPVKGGTIECYIDNVNTQTAGITFTPDGADEPIDIACVQADGDTLSVMTYNDVWTEDYTDKFSLSIAEMTKSVSESYQPDSHKL